ncbi:adenylyl cyclase-associated protein [Rutstroemia sp. NJR-2017a BBW]|nr:adenylyl cyclase-associated protein [Rutstroemia sp. NJR-2017a BBW]
MALEAATSRLEDIASSTIAPPPAADIPPQNGTIAAPTPNPAAPSVAPPAPTVVKTAPEEPLPESVEGFDSFISGPVKKYVDISKKIGGVVADQAASVLKAFEGQRRFILITTKAKKPDMSSGSFLQLIKPLQESISAVNDIRDANRGSPFFNHLSAVSESIGVLAWVTVDTKPYKHIDDSLGSAQYYGNRVLKEYKDKDAAQVEWIQAYYSIFKQLSVYVKDTFSNGIPWNPKGPDVETASRNVDQKAPSAPSSAPKPAGAGPPGPPAPPPPPPPPVFDDIPKAAPKADASSGLGAVFSELNKGEAVTKGLRKVNAEQMTHKNPSLRAGATVPTRSDSQSSLSSNRGKSPAPGKKPKPESMRTKKPPVKRLEGKKWIIENFENEPEPIEIEVDLSQSILISRCVKTTIMVKGKANAITIDNSPRLSLVVESLVSSIDVIKAPNLALQVLGVLPTIIMDQVDGAQIYLGKDSLNTEIFTSKCASVNILTPQGEEGDYKESPLAEQFRTYIKNGKVYSEIVEHAG